MVASALVPSALAQLDLGNLESFANTATDYEDAGLFVGSGDYGFGYNDFTGGSVSFFNLSHVAPLSH